MAVLQIEDQDRFASTLLAALATLDEKGTDATVTKAMAIVHEGFRQRGLGKPITACDLVAAAEAAL